MSQRPREQVILPRPEPEPLLASSAMHEKYGGMLKLLFEHLFGSIHYPSERADTVRRLAQEGVVVYVARAPSTWLALYFNFALSRLNLPLASFVGGVNLCLWQPVEHLWRLMHQRMREGNRRRARSDTNVPNHREAVLADNVFRGEAAFLFLQEQRRERRPRHNDHLRVLIAAQRVSQRPIFLIPHAVTSLGQGGTTRSSLRHRLFGTRRLRRPGRRPPPGLRLLGRARYHRANVRVGDAINIKALLDDHPDADDESLARRLRHEVDRRISEEERVVAGPEMPALETLTRRVLRNPHLRQVIDDESKADNKSPGALEQKAKRYLREIAARYKPGHTNVLANIMSWVFNTIYDGVVVDEEGLSRVLDVARRAPVIFCPSHRSHIDYLVLSTTMWLHGVAPPHIAAGANLSFFPLGMIFRGSGAFFLRRSFRGNRIYGATFGAYLTELLRHGTMLEFFIEGTRSRTGKVLMPRLGLLSMVVDAWRRGARDDIYFAPVSIDYEQIIEAGAYERELRGGEKQPEDISGLVKTARVLRSRYGRVHLQFAEPISLAAVAASSGLPQDAAAQYDEGWRREIERLGYRILHQVATCSSVTPTAIAATILLGHHGRGIARGRLIERSLELIDYLDTALARFSAAVLDPEARERAVLEAVQTMVEQSSVVVDRPGRSDLEPIYRVVDERRIQLDYYKNALMNYMAPAALIARALMRRGMQEIAYDDLCNDTRLLSRLFKREFLYRADAGFVTYLDESLASLAVRGFIDVHDDGRVTVREAEPVRLLAGLLDSFLESYWVTISTTEELKRFPMWKKEMVSRALERARRAFLEGTISRPEAASRTLVDNAIDWMVSTGVLEVQQDSKRPPLKLSAKYSGDRLDRLVEDIAAFL